MHESDTCFIVFHVLENIKANHRIDLFRNLEGSSPERSNLSMVICVAETNFP
jgi:hypothetical protein